MEDYNISFVLPINLASKNLSQVKSFIAFRGLLSRFLIVFGEVVYERHIRVDINPTKKESKSDQNNP